MYYTGNNHIEYARKFLQKDKKIFIETNYSNERLIAQRGVFEIQHSKDCDNSKTSIILINNNARKEILKYINSLGLNYYIILNDPKSNSDIVNKTLDNSISFNHKIEYDKEI